MHQAINHKKYTTHHLPKSNTSTQTQDYQQINQPSQIYYKNNTLKISNNQKLKITLCKNYQEIGICSYGPKCQFAHGINDLRSNAHNFNLYKSKPCHSFYNKGFCRYGLICKYNHRVGDDNARCISDQMRIEWKFGQQIVMKGRTSKILKLLNIDEMESGAS